MNRLSFVKLAAVLAIAIAAVAFPEYGMSIAAAAPMLFVGDVLDVFKQDAFGVVSLTDAINKTPFVPGRAGTLVDWGSSGVSTLTILVEEQNGVLSIVNPSPRGGPGDTIDKQKRNMRPLVIPHYQRNDAIYADEVQGVREFGQEQSVQTVQGAIDRRFAEHKASFDFTLEYQRLGALKGLVLNGDGSTLLDLFDAFGVTQEAEIAFDLTNASESLLRKKCAGVIRTMANNLQAVAFAGVHAVCGDNFFDDLLANAGVVASYKNTTMAEVLRTPYVYPNSGMMVYGAFEFGGIVWENYRGAIGATAMVDTDHCNLFPMNVPGLFRTRFGPADYIETVNTIGLPRYAKQYPMPNDKGVYLEMQMNGISYCTRPKVLMVGKKGA